MNPAADFVACARCGMYVAIGAADVVGNGYRCEACSLGAALDVADDGAPDRADIGWHGAGNASWATISLGVVILLLLFVLGGEAGVCLGLLAASAVASLYRAIRSRVARARPRETSDVG